MSFLDELNSHWNRDSTIYVAKTNMTGENIYFNFDGTIVPEEKRGNSEVRSLVHMFTYEEYIDEYQRYVEKMSGLMKSISDGDYWEKADSKMPDSLVFKFKYPDGKQGDIDYYLATEYGQIEKIGSIEYSATISTEYKDQISLMLYCYYPSLQIDDSFDRKEIAQFLNTYNKSHILRLLCDVCISLPYRDEFRGFPSTFQYHPLRNMGRDLAAQYIERIRKRRSEIYSFLVSQKRTTGKWASEQKLYAMVKAIYEDSIYQYKADWLGLQSIDIFIPCLKIAIEYQGIQHYEPVSIFGGEQGLVETQRRDEIKREKCIENNVKLLEWKYDLPVTMENVIGLIGD